MEMEVLKTINFSLTCVVTVADFADILLIGSDFNIKYKVEFLCDVTLLSYDLLKFSPSIIAGVCFVIAANSFNNFKFYSLRLDHFVTIKGIILKELPGLKAVKEKYRKVCVKLRYPIKND
jgi:hypothetical protein